MNVKQHLKRKWLEPKQLAELKKSGKTIATLNGSFDLLHAGHLHILYEASKQADVLIICVNTDRSIQEYKDPTRPIIPLEERMQMLAALEYVDYVISFDETDPCRILSEIDPDVHVNGAEYGADCIETSVVRKLHLVDRIPGLATSEIVEKIKQCV